MYYCIKCDVEKKNQQIETERKKEWDKKEIWLLTWGIFSFVRAVKGRPPQTAVKNTAEVIQYCISHQNHAFTQRTHKGSLSSAHTTPSKNMVYWATSAERTHTGLQFVSWGQYIKVCYISAGLFNTTASSEPHFWDPEPVAPLWILQKGAPKIWRIEKEAHTYILYSSNFFQSSEIHLALVTIWPLP